MKQTLYHNLVPESLREKLYDADVRRYQMEQAQQRRSIEGALPQSELSPAYIANLQVRANRNDLLKEMPKRAVVAEIGAGTGEFSNNIWLITDPKQLLLIDPWPGQETGDETMNIVANKFKKEIGDGHLVLHRGTPLSILADFDDGYFDWVYIGSDPSYETTAAVLELCRAKVNKHGLIAGYNYGTGSYVEMVRYGVIEAVHEFCKKHKWEMVYLTHESHRRLSYALQCIDL